MEYAVAYLRLSKEDENKGEESGSISNQRKIIKAYCERTGLCLVHEFVDDDFSGGNFNRPGFQEMLRYLDEHREIGTLITKDLSRLGRDMSESSFYAERYFPEHDIHYLAIDDSYDSEKENLLAPFQFAMNDIYLRDSSKKVKNALHVMMDHGEYCFGAPYGYKKDRADNHHLVPDEETAWVVRDIFSMACAGDSSLTIAKSLTQRNIPPPLKYRVENLEPAGSGNREHMSDTWNSTTVRRIMRNPVYLGNTVLGKTKKVSPKSEMKRKVPEAEWHVTKNTHEPLVSQSDFDLASSRQAKRSSDFRQYDHVRKSIFGGITYCATCGAAMCSCGTVYKGERERYWYLSCQNIPARSRHQCLDGARIPYSVLKEVVTDEIRFYLEMTPEKKQAIVESLVKQDRSSAKIEEAKKKTQEAEARLRQIDQNVCKIYDDMYSDRIPEAHARMMLEKYKKETEALTEQIAKFNQLISMTSAREEQYKRFFALLEEVTDFDELDEDLLHHLVDRIEISPRHYVDGQKHGARSKVDYTQDVRIYFKFIGFDDISKYQ